MRPALLALVSSTLVASAAFLLVLYRLDPRSGPGAPVAFFLTLFLALTGLCTLLTFGFRRWLQRNELVFRALGVAFKEGALVAGVVTALLVLQAFRALTWWGALLILVAAILVEVSFFANLGDHAESER